jgi:hypothetical protein
MQRQPRLGDILDDYCPRERRVTNHVVVAMVGPEVKQTRCTTCESDHEYKHAKVPRQRKKTDSPEGLYAQVAAQAPKRVAPEPVVMDDPADEEAAAAPSGGQPPAAKPRLPQSLSDLLAAATEAEERASMRVGADDTADLHDEHDDDVEVEGGGEGPVHRQLIRATLPRQEGAPPPQRPAPDFTIRQPTGRQNRFPPRHQRGGPPPFAGRSNGNAPNGPSRGGMPRQNSGRPPQGAVPSHPPRRHGRKRSK